MKSKQHLKIKDCSVCKKFFLNTTKYFPRRHSGNLRGECRNCKNNYIREYRARTRKENPDKYRDYYKNSNLKSNYGITLEEYNLMHEKQQGKCAICGVKDNNKIKNLNVDHNHNTGKTRELLCKQCNTALGYVEKDLEKVEKFKMYLNKHYVEDYCI